MLISIVDFHGFVLYFDNFLCFLQIYILCITDLYLFLSRDEYESEGSEASDDDGRPFTRTELQAKVMKTVRKRESAARREGFRYDLSDAREKAKKDKGKGGKR